MSETTIKWIAGVGGGIASFLFGGWDSALTALAVFMGIDYLTGFLAAGKAGKLNSNVGLWGIAKKAGVFAVVAVVHQLDLHLLEGQADVFRDGAIFFFLANEALSILENCGRLGVPIPPGVRRAVEELQGKGEEKK